MKNFRILEQERIFKKANRDCLVCKKEYEVYAYFGNEAFTVPFECNKCYHILWYDFYTDKYFDTLSKKMNEKTKLIWTEIENEISPCLKCNGHYKLSDWVTYGTPEHCPHCHISQKTNGTPLNESKLKLENKIRTVKENVNFLVSAEA